MIEYERTAASRPYEMKGEYIMLTNKKWWKAAGIRALKTVAQTAIATIGSAALIESVNWLTVVSASALAGVLSLLTSLAGLPEVDGQ